MDFSQEIFVVAVKSNPSRVNQLKKSAGKVKWFQLGQGIIRTYLPIFHYKLWFSIFRLPFPWSPYSVVPFNNNFYNVLVKPLYCLSSSLYFSMLKAAQKWLGALSDSYIEVQSFTPKLETIRVWPLKWVSLKYLEIKWVVSVLCVLVYAFSQATEITVLNPPLFESSMQKDF